MGLHAFDGLQQLLGHPRNAGALWSSGGVGVLKHRETEQNEASGSQTLSKSFNHVWVSHMKTFHLHQDSCPVKTLDLLRTQHFLSGFK